MTTSNFKQSPGQMNDENAIQDYFNCYGMGDLTRVYGSTAANRGGGGGGRGGAVQSNSARTVSGVGSYSGTMMACGAPLRVV